MGFNSGFKGLMIISVDLIRIPLDYVMCILNFPDFLGRNGQNLTLEVQNSMSHRNFFPFYFCFICSCFLLVLWNAQTLRQPLKADNVEHGSLSCINCACML
jgi:hypothetical protein